MRGPILILLGIAAGSSACTHPAPITDDFSDLRGVSTKSDEFSRKVRIVGTLAYGQTTDAFDYFNPPQYRAIEFRGNANDAVDLTVHVVFAGAARLWLVDALFTVVRSADGAPDAHLSATLPLNSLDGSHTFYAIVRENELMSTSFTIQLDGTPAQPGVVSACNGGPSLCNGNAACETCINDGACASGPDPVWDGSGCVCADPSNPSTCQLPYCCATGASWDATACDCVAM
jgi:hypothetical protein